MKVICERVKQSESAQNLRRDFKAFLVDIVNKFSVDVWMFSIEVCLKTLQSSGVVRLHAHAFLKKSTQIHIRSAATVAFKYSVPNRQQQVHGQRVVKQGSWCGAYYVQCPKVGGIFQDGNRSPYENHGVNGSWIFNLAQSGKMEYGVARTELIRTAQGLPRKLADLDKWHQESQKLSLENRIRETQALLGESLSPFRELPAVTSWMAECARPSFRKRFLVLEGPSGLGKTEYVKHLYGREHTLELNCACSEHVQLRDFDATIHKCIFWDEARPKLIASQRKLFQCPAAWIDLGGDSNTGAFTYRVWVNYAVMVIGSNCWTERLEQLPFSDAAWIMANQVLVRVTEPLYRTD